MSSQTPFIVYPAIDLRSGKVVRLRHGDPAQQTAYSSEPLSIARAWIDLGVRWIHLVNLDGALDETGSANLQVIEKLSKVINDESIKVQFGGGLRSLVAIKTAIDLGFTRVILGTAAIENPEVTRQALNMFGPERIAVSLDSMDGYVRSHGWQQGTQILAESFGKELFVQGVRWVVFTDISRDGTGKGVNIPETARLAQSTGLNVIASGGVHSTKDLSAAREAGLPGIIVGRAIHEGSISIQECLRIMEVGE